MTFQASQFTATQWDTIQDKAAFANQFVQFVQSDFAVKHFTERFYRRLSNTFGHIAHYNRGGFWAEFFTTTDDKVRFLEQCLQYPCYGDPAWTYSDVEKALQGWLRTCGLLDRYRQEVAEGTEAAERVELARLQEKYG
jgi:hypothetical protein